MRERTPTQATPGADFLVIGVLAWLVALAAWKGFGADQMGTLIGGVLFLGGTVLVLIGSVAIGVRMGMRGLAAADATRDSSEKTGADPGA